MEDILIQNMEEVIQNYSPTVMFPWDTQYLKHKKTDHI